MKKEFCSILFLMLFVGFAVEAAAGVPEGYYKNADGKKKSALKLAMKAIVSTFCLERRWLQKGTTSRV